jgi:hypothetical protein
MSNVQSIAQSIHLLQPKHYLLPWLAHALGTLAGATLAYLLAANLRLTLSFAVGIVSLAGGLAAATMIPAPKWFLVVDLVGAYLPMAWLGGLLGARLRSKPTTAKKII